MLRVGMAQMTPRLGDLDQNLEKHLDMIQVARAQGASVVVFPELGLTGYALRDLTLAVAMRVDDPRISRLIRESTDLDLVFSFIEESDDHRFYITSIYASKGQALHRHRKLYPPTYGLFEEQRHVARGETLTSFQTAYGTTGLLICEDAWHPSSLYTLSLTGTGVIYVIAAGPGRALSGSADSSSQQFWQRMIRTHAQLFTTFIVFVNRTGFEDGLHFFGHSFVAGPDGEILFEVKDDKEGLHLADLNEAQLRSVRYRSPFLRDEDPESALRRMKQALRAGRENG
ncbi:nitrilase-related carbon-nitrogen hydrolase [Ferroacidibacillus organovorans]|uniref:CN hydrolase domain-containing protein n=1 Tax=Ferroacidibacillus organovorans TaxID=1765683 RepID=A0A101XNT6_9BACL|nr:nitrilase-related carbon-nitrogen hydrolase [Ferroacidibacillus organovorans]KUO94847.1 hypothetical protein ATW55_10605 [Ferroacidibacillus organovorans]